MRIEAAGQRLARQAANWILAAKSILNRSKIAKLDRADVRSAQLEKLRGISVPDRRADMLAFYEIFEDLVELLCDAAQYGPTPHLVKCYGSVSKRYLAGYEVVRPFLISYVRFSQDDDPRLYSSKHSDPFQSLADAQDLNQLLRDDDGSMISRIIRTREALNLYAEHLRQLSARKG